jgi:hypothetical protein
LPTYECCDKNSEAVIIIDADNTDAAFTRINEMLKDSWGWRIAEAI